MAMKRKYPVGIQSFESLRMGARLHRRCQDVLRRRTIHGVIPYGKTQHYRQGLAIT